MIPRCGETVKRARLRRPLRRQPERLRFAFIEGIEFKRGSDDREAGRRRFLAWHDLPGTRSVLSALAVSRRLTPRQKLLSFWTHLVAAFERYNVTGKAPALLGDAAGRSRARGESFARPALSGGAKPG